MSLGSRLPGDPGRGASLPAATPHGPQRSGHRPLQRPDRRNAAGPAPRASRVLPERPGRLGPGHDECGAGRRRRLDRHRVRLRAVRLPRLEWPVCEVPVAGWFGESPEARRRSRSRVSATGIASICGRALRHRTGISGPSRGRGRSARSDRHPRDARRDIERRPRPAGRGRRERRGAEGQDALGAASVDGAASDGALDGRRRGLGARDGRRRRWRRGVLQATMAPPMDPARTRDSRIRLIMWRVPPLSQGAVRVQAPRVAGTTTVRDVSERESDGCPARSGSDRCSLLADRAAPSVVTPRTTC